MKRGLRALLVLLVCCWLAPHVTGDVAHAVPLCPLNAPPFIGADPPCKVIRAAMNGDLEKLFEEVGKDLSLVDASDVEGNSVLMWAIRSDRDGIAFELLALGVRSRWRNKHGDGAVNLAGQRGKTQLLAAIKERDAKTLLQWSEEIRAGKFGEALQTYDRWILWYPTALPSTPKHGSSCSGLRDNDAVALAGDALESAGDAAVAAFLRALVSRSGPEAGQSRGWLHIGERAVASSAPQTLDAALTRLTSSFDVSCLASRAVQHAASPAVLEMIARHPQYGGPSRELLADVVAHFGAGADAVAFDVLAGSRQPLEETAAKAIEAAVELWLRARRDPLPALVALSRLGAKLPAGSDVLAQAISGGEWRPKVVRALLPFGARADVNSRRDPEGWPLDRMLDVVFRDWPAAASPPTPVEVQELTEALIRAGAPLGPTRDDARNRPLWAKLPVARVADAKTNRDLVPGVLDVLDAAGAPVVADDRPDPLCSALRRGDVDLVRRLAAFRSLRPETPGEAFACARAIGREWPGTGGRRRQFLSVLREAGLRASEKVFEAELELDVSEAADVGTLVELGRAGGSSGYRDAKQVRERMSALGLPDRRAAELLEELRRHGIIWVPTK